MTAWRRAIHRDSSSSPGPRGYAQQALVGTERARGAISVLLEPVAVESASVQASGNRRASADLRRSRCMRRHVTIRRRHRLAPDAPSRRPSADLHHRSGARARAPAVHGEWASVPSSVATAIQNPDVPLEPDLRSDSTVDLGHDLGAVQSTPASSSALIAGTIASPVRAPPSAAVGSPRTESFSDRPRVTASPRLSDSDAARGRRAQPRYRFPDGIGDP